MTLVITEIYSKEKALEIAAKIDKSGKYKNPVEVRESPVSILYEVVTNETDIPHLQNRPCTAIGLGLETDIHTIATRLKDVKGRQTYVSVMGIVIKTAVMRKICTIYKGATVRLVALENTLQLTILNDSIESVLWLNHQDGIEYDKDLFTIDEVDIIETAN